MNKSVIALLGASAFVLSTAGIAGGTTRVPGANTDANNSAAGVYVSGNVGYGNVDVKLPSNLAPGFSASRSGFAWSGALGYQFNPYVAVEGGYIQFADVEFRRDSANNVKVFTDAIDLVVKGIYPINQQFNVFGKAGIAYMSHSELVATDSVTLATGDTNHHVVPLFGLGASYNLTQNLAVDVQGITTIKSGKNKTFPATYTGLVGLTYKFS